MLSNFGTTEIIIIAIIVLVLFGGKKLPELGRGIGESIREFKDSLSPSDKNKKSS